MIINHAEEKREKARIIINYKKFNDNTVFDGYYISNKTILFNRFKEPIGFQKWIVKVKTDKEK